MKRKIAAILAADAVEYSRLVAENEEEALLQLVASVEVFRSSVEAHGGRVFNTAGDAVLAEFQSAVEAVRSALDIQEKLAARNATSPADRRMMFRMGISIGDVVENGGDLLGDGVNIAARLQSLSQPGGLAVSRWVQEQVAGKVGTDFHDAGYQPVKNMPAPIHVFRSVPRASGEPPSVEVPAHPRARAYLILTVGCAALVAAIVFGLTWKDLPDTAVQQTPPASGTPDPSPTVARQIPEQSSPAQQDVLHTPAPKDSLVPEGAPAPTETAEPPAESAPVVASPQPDFAAPPKAAEPAGKATSLGPSDSAPIAGDTVVSPPALRQETEPPSAPIIAREPPAERQTARKQCAEVLERAQLGELTTDDRDFLRSNCR
jgi:class 3 adenylate cyclase